MLLLMVECICESNSFVANGCRSSSVCWLTPNGIDNGFYKLVMVRTIIKQLLMAVTSCECNSVVANSCGSSSAGVGNARSHYKILGNVVGIANAILQCSCEIAPTTSSFLITSSSATPTSPSTSDVAILQENVTTVLSNLELRC